MSISRIKKNDEVIVINSAEAGKKGKVLVVNTSKERAIVQGVRLISKCVRKSQENPKGGIIKKEGSIAVSNLMLYCPKCLKGVKTKIVKESDKSIRKCKKCGHAFDI